MLTKTINITLGVLVTVTVWCAALMLAVLIAILALHVVIMGGATVFNLLNS